MKKIYIFISVLFLLSIGSSCSKWNNKNLSIVTAPGGGSIIILSKGKQAATGTSPAEFNLNKGAYTVIIKKKGYKDFISEIEIKNKRENISAQLIPFPGMLKVSSFPENAKIYIDNAFQGRTPRTINNIDAGPHLLTVTLSGYSDYNDTVLIEPGRTAEKSAVLYGGEGQLDIHIDRTAAIYVDSVLKTNAAELKQRLSAGPHTVYVQKNGYVPYKKKVVIAKDKTINLKLKLKKAKDLTKVKFFIKPPNAALKLNGIPQPSRSITLPYAEYEVEAALDKYEKYKQELSISGKEKDIYINLAPLPGNITITSVPPQAEVFLNDIMSGLTPLTLVGYKSDKYVLKVKKHGYNLVDNSFNLEPAGQRNFAFILKKHYKYVLRKAFLYVKGTPSTMANPVYTLLSDNNIMIADAQNSRVVIVTPAGITKGFLQEKDIMQQPVALMNDKFKNTFVVDKGTNRILKFSAAGKFLQFYGGTGNAPGKFREPTDIAKYKEKYVYVVDPKNYRVQIFNRDFKFLTAFGIRGSHSGQLLLPTGLAVHPTAGLFLTDAERHAILNFTYLGIFKKERRVKYAPLYVVADNSGNLLVSGSDGKIRKYDQDMNFIEELDVKDITLYRPGHLAVPAGGSELIVPDIENDKVYLLEKVWDETYYP